MNSDNKDKRFKTIIFVLAFMLIFFQKSTAQIGVGIGFFIPSTGYVANVYGPLSLRGVGFSINKIFTVQTGFTVYSMPGNAVTHLPFKAKEPLFGASTTLLVPLEFGLGTRIGNVSISASAGGFMFYNFTHRLDKGNFDRAISEYEGWDVTNADLNYTNRPGYGFITSFEIEYHVNKKLGIYIQYSYLDGESVLELNGNYKGGNLGGNIIEKTAAFNDARLSIKGSEVSVGVHF
ncbi:MAG: hypothetical protein JHD28_06795 [Bacteroidia bacterium]|nr:hypothetical protein [Bacteroidia bacterium]